MCSIIPFIIIAECQALCYKGFMGNISFNLFSKYVDVYRYYLYFEEKEIQV